MTAIGLQDETSTPLQRQLRHCRNFSLERPTALPYILPAQTVVETPEYLAAAKRAGMSDAERESAVNFIAANPDAGEIIPGTGGCRKVRIAREGKGKSGGYRVISYYSTHDEPVFLLTVISKGKQANLTDRQKNELRKGKAK